MKKCSQLHMKQSMKMPIHWHLQVTLNMKICHRILFNFKILKGTYPNLVVAVTEFY